MLGSGAHYHGRDVDEELEGAELQSADDNIQIESDVGREGRKQLTTLLID